MDKQWGPAVQHGELHPASWDRPGWKMIWERNIPICVTTSPCGTIDFGTPLWIHHTYKINKGRECLEAGFMHFLFWLQLYFLASPGGSVDEGSRVVTAVAWVSAVAWVPSLAWEFLHAGRHSQNKKKKSVKPLHFQISGNWQRVLTRLGLLCKAELEIFDQRLISEKWFTWEHSLKNLISLFVPG